MLRLEAKTRLSCFVALETFKYDAWNLKAIIGFVYSRIIIGGFKV